MNVFGFFKVMWKIQVELCVVIFNWIIFFQVMIDVFFVEGWLVIVF